MVSLRELRRGKVMRSSAIHGSRLGKIGAGSSAHGAMMVRGSSDVLVWLAPSCAGRSLKMRCLSN